MPLQKQPVNISFGSGLNLKNDPKHIAPGQFLELENTVFDKGGLLQKRNGFQQISSLGSNSYKYVTTFNGNLTAVGSSLSAYSNANSTWNTKASISPIDLSTLSLVRTSSNQSQVDTAIAPNGLVCTVFTETAPSTSYKYVIADSVTGQNIVPPTLLVTPTESPRVFLLGNYFIIVYPESTSISYVAVPVNNPTSPLAEANLVVNYTSGGTQLAYDGIVTNNNLYIAYNASDGGGAIRMTYLNTFFVRQTPNTGAVVTAAKSATMLSVCSDETATSNPIIWITWYKTAGTEGWVRAMDAQMNSVLTATQIISAGTILNITSTAQNNVVTAFYEVSTVYSYGAGLATNIINQRTCTTAASLGTATTIARSVGLASKAFLLNGTPYMLSAYSSVYQPSYFLMDSSGNILSKLAYSNGGGYLTLGLPSVNVTGTIARMGYLIKDLLIAANKSQNPISNAPVFTQTGINLVSFNFTTVGLNSSEIGGNLHLSGGVLWAYDGYQLVEQGFSVYPDNVIVTTTTGAGNITAQTYFYVAIYEWTDNQGNVHRSAPSLAVSQVTTTSSSTNTIKIPTLRLTYKTANPVKIVLYRWSTSQQTYFQVTSLTSPTLNSTTSDSVTITDTFADSAIVGNSILYTTGGVIENIGAPSTKAMTLYRSRLFLVDGEDQNLIWYSKQVIESTPVEMSDLLTIFVPPTVSAQTDTGPITALYAMDDKLIIFKKNAIYYLTGIGPDNTGANNDFSDPVFITSTVGCDNQNSIVFIPTGIMFQSDKGIWLLSRDLSTNYIGAAVEDFNTSTVLSAVSVPGTNQVRFTLNTGETLMFDYYFSQWGSFSGVPGISSALYQKLHTFIDSSGRVFQENIGNYLDGSRPVLINFRTGWFSVAGLQGFERAYFFYLLGTYYSPHRITVSIGFDYNDSPAQRVVINPNNINYSGPYGNTTTSPVYGSPSPYGGNSSLEPWRVFFNQQKCQAFQLKITESYDSTLGQAAGAGFTMSGINLIVGTKGGYPRLPAAQTIG